LIESDSRFPNRTNVQFMQILDRSNISIEIWERGAGYTLASGSSSSAAAAVAHRLGLCDHEITVHMPGGRIEIMIAPNYAISMTGSVTRVATGTIDPEMFERLNTVGEN
jgi:diaminopimelate epimerase